MPRSCCGCLSICCFSGKKRKSFPIHERQRETEITKVFIKHVENIRLTPPPPPITSCQQDKTTKSKATMKYKTGQQTKKQTVNKKDSSNSRTPVSKLFETPKNLKTSSPIPVAIRNISEENHNKAAINSSSSWSSSTNSDLSKENVSQPKKRSNDVKPSVKSKLVLENVRKMIKDQNIQQQHFNHTQQKESARL